MKASVPCNCAEDCAVLINIAVLPKDRKELYYRRTKASAADRKLNSMLIVLPVCRNLVTFVRAVALCQCRRTIVRRRFDRNTAFHELHAHVIYFWPIVHFFADTFNPERYWLTHEHTENSTRPLLSALNDLLNQPNATRLSLIRTNTPASNPLLELDNYIAGCTGVIIIVPPIHIVSSCTDVLWYTHHLFAVYNIGFVTRFRGHLYVYNTEFWINTMNG